MRIFLFLLSAVFSISLAGQDYVVVAPPSLTPLSEGVITTANTALAAAAQNTDFEVKMAFFTSASGTGDRYEQYKSYTDEQYMDFFRTPYQSGFGEDPNGLQQEHDRLRALAVEALGGGGGNSVYVVYTSVLNLTSEGTDYSRRKSVFYGTDFSSCDQRRFEQIDEFIDPPEDFSPVASMAENDTYLNWYSSRLASAAAPDYVVTGTIRFQGAVYCGGEYIWLNDQQDEVVPVNTASPNHPVVEVLVNPESPTPNVTWSEAQEDNATIYDSKNGLEATLAFYPETYGQFNEVKAFYDGPASTSIYVRPVNLKVTVRPGILEKHLPDPFEFEYFNNSIPFSNRGSLDIRLQGTFTHSPDLTVPSEENNISWMPSEDLCDEFTVFSKIEGASSLQNIELENDLNIKCEFFLAGIETEVIYENHLDDDAPTPPIMRKATIEDDTLFIVTDDSNDNDDGTRDLVYDLKWEGDEEPTADQFWAAPPYQVQPSWEFTGHQQPSSIQPNRNDGGSVATAYNSHFPDDFVFPAQLYYANHRANTIDSWRVNTVTVNAFKGTDTKHVVFLSRNESRGANITSDLLPGSLLQKIRKVKEIEQQLDGVLKGKILDYFPGAKITPKFEVAYEETRFNSEPPNSVKYLENEKGKLSGTFGIQLTGAGDTDFAPLAPPYGFSVNTPVGHIAGGIGINFLAAFTPSTEWTFSKLHHLSNENVNWEGNITEIVVGGEMNAGIAFFLDEDIPGIEVEASLAASVVFAMTVTFSANDVTGGYDIKVVFPFPVLQITGSIGANVAGVNLISWGGDDPLFEFPPEGWWPDVEVKF